GDGTPFAIAVGYGEGHSTATTTITNTTITGQNAVAVTSSATTKDSPKARTSANPLSTVNPNTVAIAVAIANPSETSHVTVSGDSSVTSNAGSINAAATGTVTNSASASPKVMQDGTAAFGVAVDFDKADIKTQIDGTLDAAGHASNTFNADP